MDRQMPDPANQKRDEAVVRVLIHFFKELIHDEEIPKEKRPDILIEYFLGYLQQKLAVANLAELATELNTDESIIDLAHELANDPLGSKRLAPVWTQVILHDRPLPRHPVRSLQLVCLVSWEDGALLPISVFTPAELMAGTFTDGLMATLMMQQPRAWFDTLIEHGLDNLHDHLANNYGDEQAFEIFMGLILRGIEQLKPEHREDAVKYMRLIQGMLRPIVPQEARIQAAAVKRQLNQSQLSSEGSGEITGGWTN